MKKLKVLIPDLTSASCVLEIEQVMRQQEGVIWAIVNFAAGEATIIYDQAAFKVSRLAQAVAQLGFQILIGDEAASLQKTRFIEPDPVSRMQQWVRALAR